MKEPKSILVTGATGFLGSHIIPILRESFAAKVIGVSHRDYDLLHPEAAEQMLADHKPEVVIHLAAKVGGIIVNLNEPANFFCENVVINTHVFHACWCAGVAKFVTFIGGCSYPATASSPITEDQMWNGLPQAESAPYAVAKKIVLIQSDAYRRQYGFNSIVLIPGNVYGEYDNFSEYGGHVIPALIRRFVEAKEKGLPRVTCYGSGRPTRDFVYAGDVARLLPWFIRNYDSSEPVNISTGVATSIGQLTEIIREATGYTGSIEWDTSRPDGQMEKIFSPKRLHALGLRCETPLREGIRITVDWFLQARKAGKVRL